MAHSEDQILKKARPFFLNFFNRLANDLNTLTAAPISCTLNDLSVMRGWDDLETVFETDRTVALVREDGKSSGDIHIVMDVATSIALAGLMMMVPEAVISEQVKNREYNDEVREGFQEIANQVVGAMNDLVEKKMEGGHLFLELPTTYHGYSESPPSLHRNWTYLSATVDIQVSNFPVAPSVWVLSKGFAEAFFNLEIQGLDEEEKELAALRAAAGGGTPAARGDDAAGPDLAEDSGNAKADAAVSGKSAEVDTAAAVFADADDQPDDAEGPRTAEEGGPLPEEPAGHAMQFADGAAPLWDGTVEDGADTLAKSPRPRLNYASDGLPHPDEPGSIKVVTTEMPFTLKEEDRVIKAINAMRHDGFKYIGVDRQGKLVRIVSQSDLRQLMGPFFGTQAMNARDKAICTLPLGKINSGQNLIAIMSSGTINQAADLILENNLRMLPVVSKQGVLRGFIPIHAVLDYFRRKRQG
ncbi:MAG: CBS domain-containing protein [Magnetococcales bacterium]|nr:CBS domain-containing protein [Magnetococcales bacterium]